MPPLVHTCYIGLGSNLKHPECQLSMAIQRITDLPLKIMAVSRFHFTKAWGLENQPDFANAVIEIITELTPQDLLKALQKIEIEMGRKRMEKWGPRIIDLDILLYDNLQINDKTLKIPHPYMLERDFVMMPLREINWKIK